MRARSTLRSTPPRPGRGRRDRSCAPRRVGRRAGHRPIAGLLRVRDVAANGHGHEHRDGGLSSTHPRRCWAAPRLSGSRELVHRASCRRRELHGDARSADETPRSTRRRSCASAAMACSRTRRSRDPRARAAAAAGSSSSSSGGAPGRRSSSSGGSSDPAAAGRQRRIPVQTLSGSAFDVWGVTSQGLVIASGRPAGPSRRAAGRGTGIGIARPRRRPCASSGTPCSRGKAARWRSERIGR